MEGACKRTHTEGRSASARERAGEKLAAPAFEGTAM